jgi:hypothetical protein
MMTLNEFPSDWNTGFGVRQTLSIFLRGNHWGLNSTSRLSSHAASAFKAFKPQCLSTLLGVLFLAIRQSKMRAGERKQRDVIVIRARDSSPKD